MKKGKLKAREKSFGLFVQRKAQEKSKIMLKHIRVRVEIERKVKGVEK